MNDNFTCTCGNRADLDGFYPCLPDGTQVEPHLNGDWDGGQYVCGRCNKVHLRADDTTNYGDCSVCGNPIIGFVSIIGNDMACTDCGE